MDTDDAVHLSRHFLRLQVRSRICSRDGRHCMILKRGDVPFAFAASLTSTRIISGFLPTAQSDEQYHFTVSLAHVSDRFAYWITAADVAAKLGRHSW